MRMSGGDRVLSVLAQEAGYRRVPEVRAQTGKQLEAHECERRILATMRKLRTGCGVTWRQMAEQLNRDGFTTRRGTPWTLHVARSAFLTAERHCGCVSGVRRRAVGRPASPYQVIRRRRSTCPPHNA